LNALLTRTDVFQKPVQTQRELARILGAGVLVAEGAQHRMQRRVLNPAFGPGQVRDLSGVFLDKSNEVRGAFA
jgi:cytochrome P450